MLDSKKIDSVEIFLSLSILLEYESADRLRELSKFMLSHQATELSELLETLAGYSDQHASEIRELSEGKVLPELATLDLSWEGLEGPETTAYESVNPNMSVEDMLQVAMRNEVKGQDFYIDISLNSPDEAVRKLAAEFASEENEHVAMLEKWIASLNKDHP
jgi:rubrerythrin